jgi:hypothetical protein
MATSFCKKHRKLPESIIVSSGSPVLANYMASAKLETLPQDASFEVFIMPTEVVHFEQASVAETKTRLWGFSFQVFLRDQARICVDHNKVLALFYSGKFP